MFQQDVDILLESFNYALLELLNDNLQKRMTMESVALGAKHQLVFLTSHEGDSYLDEMSSLVHNCSHLMRLASSAYSSQQVGPVGDLLASGIGSLDSLDLVFRSLKSVIADLPLADLMTACFNDDHDSSTSSFATLDSMLQQIDLDSFFAAISRQGFQQFDFSTEITFFLSSSQKIKVVEPKRKRLCSTLFHQNSKKKVPKFFQCID